MATTTSLEPVSAPSRLSDPAYQAFTLLRVGFTVAPILFGLDKFLNWLVDWRIYLVGDESAAPYERPSLSKAVLRGEAEADATRVHPDGFYAEHDIDVVHDRVVRLDSLVRDITLVNGGSLHFDTAVLATGA